MSVRLATGSIVSMHKVLLPLTVKFDDFNSVEPFIVLDMDDRYDLILGMPWLVKHEPWIDWRSRTIGASHKPLADRALVGHVPSSSRDGFVHEHQLPCSDRHLAGSAEVVATREDGGREGSPINSADSGRAVPPTTQSVQSTSGCSVGGDQRESLLLDAESGRFGAPTTQCVQFIGPMRSNTVRITGVALSMIVE